MPTGMLELISILPVTRSACVRGVFWRTLDPALMHFDSSLFVSTGVYLMQIWKRSSHSELEEFCAEKRVASALTLFRASPNGVDATAAHENDADDPHGAEKAHSGGAGGDGGRGAGAGGRGAPLHVEQSSCHSVVKSRTCSTSTERIMRCGPSPSTRTRTSKSVVVALSLGQRLNKA